MFSCDIGEFTLSRLTTEQTISSVNIATHFSKPALNYFLGTWGQQKQAVKLTYRHLITNIIVHSIFLFQPLTNTISHRP